MSGALFNIDTLFELATFCFGAVAEVCLFLNLSKLDLMLEYVLL